MNTKQVCDEVFDADVPYIYKKDAFDYWKTPAEFVKDGGGDCEDWCIYWRDQLIKKGVPEASIWLTMIPWTPTESHMILLVEDGGMLWRLDILSYTVTETSSPEMHQLLGNGTWIRFNSEDCFKYSEWVRTAHKATSIKKWADCMERMKTFTIRQEVKND